MSNHEDWVLARKYEILRKCLDDMLRSHRFKEFDNFTNSYEIGKHGILQHVDAILKNDDKMKFDEVPE